MEEIRQLLTNMNEERKVKCDRDEGFPDSRSSRRQSFVRDDSLMSVEEDASSIDSMEADKSISGCNSSPRSSRRGSFMQMQSFSVHSSSPALTWPEKAPTGSVASDLQDNSFSAQSKQSIPTSLGGATGSTPAGESNLGSRPGAQSIKWSQSRGHSSSWGRQGGRGSKGSTNTSNRMSMYIPMEVSF